MKYTVALLFQSSPLGRHKELFPLFWYTSVLKVEMTDWFRVNQVRGSVRSGRHFWGLVYVSLCGLFSTSSSWNHQKWIVTKATETNREIKLLNKRATHEVTEFIMWLAPWAGEMNQILRSDWLPERTSWSYISCPLGITLCVPRENRVLFWYNKSFNDQSCSVKMADISLVFACGPRLQVPIRLWGRDFYHQSSANNLLF